MSTLNLGVHQESKTFLTDAAITTKHLLYKQGSDANHVAVCDASSVPIGTIPDLCSAAEASRTVLLIGKGPTKIMVANGVVTAGAAVYAAASGKIASSGTYCVGFAMGTTASDGDQVEVADTILATTTGMLATLYAAADTTNNVVLYAAAANTPAALKVTASTLVGRSSSGNLVALTAAQTHGILGNTHKIVAAGTHNWAGGAAPTDTIAAAAVTTGDFIHCQVVAKNSTEYILTAAVNTGVGIDIVMNGSGAANTTTKIHYIAVRAV